MLCRMLSQEKKQHSGGNAGAPPKQTFCLVLPKWLGVKRSWWVPKLLPRVEMSLLPLTQTFVEILVLTLTPSQPFFSHNCYVT